VDPKTFFSDSDPQNFFSDSDTYSDTDSADIYFGTNHFFNGLRIFSEYNTTKKNFVTVKICASFHLTLVFVMLNYQIIVSGSESVSESEFFSNSDSDPAKSFGFIRIRIRNTALHTRSQAEIFGSGSSKNVPIQQLRLHITSGLPTVP
jgi:hypothetical protein